MILRYLRGFLCQLIWLTTLLRGFTRGAGNREAMQLAA